LTCSFDTVSAMPSRFDAYATHHTSRRLEGWDYTQAAAYFLTLCTHQRQCRFGTVTDERVVLTPTGRIVVEEWHRSEAMRDEVTLDAFVVMPNHLHGIVAFAPDTTGPLAASEAPAGSSGAPGPRKASHGGATLHDGGDRSGDGTEAPDRDGDTPPLHRPPRSLGSFVAGFKSAVTRRVNRRRGTPGAPLWQRNYHDRIIRTARHLHAARRYIRDNPANWPGDRHRPDP
jgi:REP element-mobilizing transposase RayT